MQKLVKRINNWYSIQCWPCYQEDKNTCYADINYQKSFDRASQSWLIYSNVFKMHNKVINKTRVDDTKVHSTIQILNTRVVLLTICICNVFHTPWGKNYIVLSTTKLGECRVDHVKIISIIKGSTDEKPHRLTLIKMHLHKPSVIEGVLVSRRKNFLTSVIFPYLLKVAELWWHKKHQI